MTSAPTHLIYRRLLRYAYPHWPIIAAAIAAMILQAGVSGLVPGLVSDVIEGLGQAVSGPIWRIPILIVLVFLVRGVMSVLGVYGLTRVGRDAVRTLRSELFDHYLVMPAKLIDHSPTGELISKLTYNSEQVAEAISTSLVILVRDSFTIIVLLAVMLHMSWELTALTAVAAPIIGVILAALGRAFRRYSARIQVSMGDVTRAADQSLRGQQVVKLFNGYEHESARFDKINRQNFRLNLRMVAVRAAGDALTQYVVALALAGVIAVAFSTSLLANVTAAVFIGFLTAMAQLLSPLKRLITVNASMQKGVVGAQSLFEMMAEPSEPDQGKMAIERVRGDLEYRHVSFAYHGKQERVLQDIDLKVPAGTSLALVGRSGSGKSTFVRLLARLDDVDNGSILLDGTDIRDYPLRDLRRQLGFVSQDVTMFDDTIANNIAFGAMANADRAAIERAAEAAYVMEFASVLPEGLDTRIGERGASLSGGQRQRIAIARAILKDAPVLILDEATSALDTQSERRVQSALANLMRGRTTIVIAHRLSTVESADRIAVMKEGMLAELGTHAELLEKGDDYAALRGLQFSVDAR